MSSRGRGLAGLVSWLLFLAVYSLVGALGVIRVKIFGYGGLLPSG